MYAGQHGIPFLRFRKKENVKYILNASCTKTRLSYKLLLDMKTLKIMFLTALDVKNANIVQFFFKILRNIEWSILIFLSPLNATEITTEIFCLSFCEMLVVITCVITRLIVINIAPLTELKDISFNTKLLLVWWD